MRPPRPFPEEKRSSDYNGGEKARNKAEFQRVQCLWLRAALGLNANQVAQALGWRPTSVRRLQAQYWRQGEALWPRLGRGGRRHQNLSVEEEAQLLAGFLKPPSAVGCWRSAGCNRLMNRRWAMPLPKSTVYRMLARHGWRKLAPRIAIPRPTQRANRLLKKLPRPLRSIALPDDPCA